MKPRLLLRVGVTALRSIDHTSPALVPDQIMHASLHAWSMDVDAAGGTRPEHTHAAMDLYGRSTRILLAFMLLYVHGGGMTY